MPARTYNGISTTTLASAQASVTISNISQSFTDLVIVVSGNMSSGGVAGVCVRFNGDTGANYSATQFDGTTSAASYRDVNYDHMNLGILDARYQNHATFHINNYSNSTSFKNILARGNSAGFYIRAACGLWRNTNSITSITFFNPSTTFALGTSFSIYGIKCE